MRIRSALFVSILLTATMAACNDGETGNDGPRKSDALFLDYRISAEEGGPEVTCKLQFRQGGPDGAAVPLDGRAEVSLDGRTLRADSSRQGGAYYEAAFPYESFIGTHRIRFAASDGAQFEERFEFRPFSLAGVLPEQVRRAPFILRLANFPRRETTLRLIMVDTSFASRDVNEVLQVVKGEVPITTAMLNDLSNGPINLEVLWEEERSVRQPTREGGRILISYSVKRDFELVP